MPFSLTSHKKLKLAFLSPLPPAPTGVAEYSSDLIEVLSDYYQIELITEQQNIELKFRGQELKIRSIEWFKANAHKYERILYHIGNNSLHIPFLLLLREHPGVVVLHDFFLSGALNYEQYANKRENIWTEALFHSHGYGALRVEQRSLEKAANTYPANLQVLEDAKHLIVHSEDSKKLIREWYGETFLAKVTKIPLLRPAPKNEGNKSLARQKLGLPDSCFLVTSFGFIEETKAHHQILEAFMSSKLSKNSDCILVFVGTNNEGTYGKNLLKMIDGSHLKKRIFITGWVSNEQYDLYLQSTDVSIQLRTTSRGETSAAVLNCLNSGVPVIVNNEGALSELPGDVVFKVPSSFENSHLTDALIKLFEDVEYREFLKRQGPKYIQSIHSPDNCSKFYRETIESSYKKCTQEESLKKKSPDSFPNELEYSTAKLKDKPTQKRFQNHWLVDVSAIARKDLKTGIQRVVRAQILRFIESPPASFKIEPVYLSDEGGRWHYRYARTYTVKLLGLNPECGLTDDPVEVIPGDVLFVADFAATMMIEAARAGLFTKWKSLGVKLCLQVYDLLPITHPFFFPKGVEASHQLWLDYMGMEMEYFFCISETVAKELRSFYQKRNSSVLPELKIFSVQLGSDIESSVPSTGLPDNAYEFLSNLKQKTVFLMVGTIEPRKGHFQTLKAFEQLWSEGEDVTLIIVGKEGWNGLLDDDRVNISLLTKKIKEHEEFNNRLFWLEGISDEFLKNVYESATSLIVASEAEGFGLPIIEGFRYGLPLIIRDIPVFREVIGSSIEPYYFKGNSPSELAETLKKWLLLFREGKGFKPSKTKQLRSWAENVDQIYQAIFDLPVLRSREQSESY